MWALLAVLHGVIGAGIVLLEYSRLFRSLLDSSGFFWILLFVCPYIVPTSTLVWSHDVRELAGSDSWILIDQLSIIYAENLSSNNLMNHSFSRFAYGIKSPSLRRLKIFSSRRARPGCCGRGWGGGSGVGGPQVQGAVQVRSDDVARRWCCRWCLFRVIYKGVWKSSCSLSRRARFYRRSDFWEKPVESCFLLSVVFVGSSKLGNDGWARAAAVLCAERSK